MCEERRYIIIIMHVKDITDLSVLFFLVWNKFKQYSFRLNMFFNIRLCDYVKMGHELINFYSGTPKNTVNPRQIKTLQLNC